ncbi:PrnB family protein [Emcibacter sp.]|uniref:PrnB family protein n=1 Tax=Emcibacter sp. TaxID=1979954 RepID=UPI002AA82252|nr:monodechloroaminopyrrolnitrin synthase PrnB family protein [Emcibacter sp.]
MSTATEQFDHWIRTSFVEMNTALEELYFCREDPADIEEIGQDIKHALVEEGNKLIRPLVNEGNTDEGFDRAYDLLGNLGLFLGALRRHELTNPAREKSSPFQEASALGLHIGASLGVAPRFATAHLADRNRAVNGVQKSFTSLKDEFIFIDYNTMGIFSYMRAADALMRISPIGISNKAAWLLLKTAREALEDVAHYNEVLFETLDVRRFFYCVRPYYKPYRVGRAEYRGANAGDFAGINQIDLLLGLCRGNDPYYAQMMVDKMPYMLPEDQKRLMDCLRRKSLLDELLEAAESSNQEDWFQCNGKAFLDVCRAHGHTAEQHHNQLVSRFIESPSGDMEEKHLKQITASGPPLPALLSALEKLRDLRMAAPRTDMITAHEKLQQLEGLLD